MPIKTYFSAQHQLKKKKKEGKTQEFMLMIEDRESMSIQFYTNLYINYNKQIKLKGKGMHTRTVSTSCVSR